LIAECVREGRHHATVAGYPPGEILLCPRCGTILVVDAAGCLSPAPPAAVLRLLMGPEGPEIERLQAQIWIGSRMAARAASLSQSQPGVQ
jgi:hypothetical protein